MVEVVTDRVDMVDEVNHMTVGASIYCSYDSFIDSNLYAAKSATH